MYKDQHVGTLQKLLNHWFEAVSLSESSEDNESNTSPPKQCSGDSSPMLTSDPTSDSSDNCSAKMITSGQESDVRMANSDYQTPLIRVKPKPNVTQKSTDSSLSMTSSDTTEFMHQDAVMKVSSKLELSKISDFHRFPIFSWPESRGVAYK
jgi:timeless